MTSLFACQAKPPSVVSANDFSAESLGPGCNDQPDSSLIAGCLNIAIDRGNLPYFKRLFAKAWSQNQLPQERGFRYLAGALQHPDPELLKFLLSQKLTFPALDLSNSSPDQVLQNINFLMTYHGFKLEKAPSSQTLDVLFKDQPFEGYRRALAWWFCDWAIRHHDSKLIDYMRQNVLKLKVGDVTTSLPLELDIQVSLVRTAFEVGNLDYLHIVEAKQFFEQKASTAFNLSASPFPVNFKDIDLSRVNQEFLDLLYLIKSHSEDEHSLEKLLRVFLGENDKSELNLEAVKYLRAKGVLLTLADDQRTPLMLVAGARNADLPLFLELASQGWDLNAKDKEAKTALFYAAEAGQQSIFDWLIAQGAETNIQSRTTGFSDGEPVFTTPLLSAVKGGNLAVVERLLPKFSPEDRFDLIYVAVREGHSHLVKFLFEKGYPITVSAFQASGVNRDLDIFTQLFNYSRSAPDLEAKLMAAYDSASIGIAWFFDNQSLPGPGYLGPDELDSLKVDRFRVHVLDKGFAHPSTHEVVWRLLPKSMALVSSEHKAQLRSWLRQGIQSGLNPNLDSGTVIINTAYAGELEILQELVAAGADLKLYGNEALKKAFEGEQFKVIDYLLNQAVPTTEFKESKLLALEQAVPYFSTPLAFAVAIPYFHPEREPLIQRLVAKTDLSLTEHQWLPFLTTHQGDLNFLKRLAQYQDLKRFNQRQENLFFALGSYQTHSVAEYLKSQGLDLNVINYQGDTALHSAVKMSQLEKLSALLDQGANPCLVDKNNKTAWKWVSEGKSFDRTLNQPVLQKLRVLSEACTVEP